MTADGITIGWRNNSFTLVVSLVTPAIPENSPADKVVGTLIWRTVGGRNDASPRHASSPSEVVIWFARQSCTAFAPSVIDPPPTVTIKSAFASHALFAAATTAERGVCAGIRSKAEAQRLPR